MNTTQQDYAMIVLYEVVIFFFIFLCIPQKIKQNTNCRVLLACITLNFMDMSRPMEVINSGAHLSLSLGLCRSSPRLSLQTTQSRPCKHRNQVMVKRSLACIHLCTCQKVQNDVSLTYSLATSRTLQKINMSAEGEASGAICLPTSQNGAISG